MAGKPNVLIIWGDDIGWFNISAYNHGITGYRTPNIDRLAREGAMFTDWYGQQSCTADRAAFITGQSPIRTGLTKVGLPGADIGLQPEDPTIAELLKPLGYATGQFGKNHLGNRDKFLPTAHGFDEFFGNLYHLNAEQEPFVKLRFPKLFNVRSDLFERADVEATMFFDKWVADRLFLFVPAQVIVKQLMQTMVEFPPRQKAASFTVGDVMEKLEQNSAQMARSAGAGT
jgi:arylsulfatase A-like enzyme